MASNYKQNDSRWAATAYAGENMASAGCGPTAVADLLDKLPTEIASWMAGHGYASNGSGTEHAGIAACIKAYGYDAQQITSYSLAGVTSTSLFEHFKYSIQQGNMGILLMGGTSTGCKDSYWSKAGHYIAVVGYENNKYYVYDPAYAARDGQHSWDDFAGDIKHMFTTTVKWKSVPKETISVDGWWGCATTKKAQHVLSCSCDDGIVSNQNKQMKSHLYGCSASSWEFVEPSKLKNGSDLIRAIQKRVGVTQDGFFGTQTIKALQKFLGVNSDGDFGNVSVIAFQNWLNKN